MVEHPVDALAIALVVGRVFPFLRDDAVERLSTADLRTRGRGQELAGKEDAQLDELAGRNVERTEEGPVGFPRDVAADRDRVTVDAVLGPGSGPGQRHRRRQASEPFLPLVAPHLEVDVDDVVVGERQPAQPVADREGPQLVLRAEVPHDPSAALDVPHAVAAG